MEVGAVKQAYNNEVILLKKKLNQAKIQIIHKLTRKAKQLAEKKAPEPLKEKLKKKAESAINEVLILKKIKPRDLAKFIVTHKGELNAFLNKPTVDNDKACARLLLHKSLQDKYKFIRGRFSNVSINDLFMSRLERRKMKQEAKEKQKNKKKAKDNQVVNSEGDWNVEDIDINNSKLTTKGVDQEEDKFADEESNSNSDNFENHENDESLSDNIESESESVYNEVTSNEPEQSGVEDVMSDNDNEVSDTIPDKTSFKDSKDKTSNDFTLSLKSNETIVPIKSTTAVDVLKAKVAKKKNTERKLKDANKNKNFNEKIQNRKFRKNSDAPNVDNKIVDPFFITSTGENYMSVVEFRTPDEVKDEHKQGNRKLRRAIMFGHVPKPKLRQDNNNYKNNYRFNSQNGYEKRDNFDSKFNNRQKFNDCKSFKNNFNETKLFNNNFGDSNTFNNNFNDRNRLNVETKDEKPEKLHPSWEAKKKKSGILPFEGKKIVFD